MLRSESRTVLEGRMEGTRTLGRQWYDDRLDEEQQCGIWTYKEKSLWYRKLASLEAWTCLKRQSTREREPRLADEGNMFSTCPSIHLSVSFQTCQHYSVETNWLILMPVGTSAVWGGASDDQLWESGGQSSQSRESQRRFGGLLEVSFSIPLVE